MHRSALYRLVQSFLFLDLDGERQPAHHERHDEAGEQLGAARDDAAIWQDEVEGQRDADHHAEETRPFGNGVFGVVGGW